METTNTNHAGCSGNLGTVLTRLGLIIVFAWIGAMKFTAYEAGAIEGLITSSPLISWAHGMFGQRMLANLIGVTELFAAALLFIGFFKPQAGMLGAGLMACTLAMTSTFLLTAPVVETSLGFPALNVVPGQFLLKDLALLGAAVWLALHDCGRSSGRCA